MEQKRIENMKRIVAIACEGRQEANLNKRKWIICPVDSYGDKSNRIEFHVLEGSPMKGFVAVDYGRDTIYAYGLDGSLLRKDYFL